MRGRIRRAIGVTGVQSEDLRGGQWKEVLEVEPIEASENKEKETNPDGSQPKRGPNR